MTKRGTKVLFTSFVIMSVILCWGTAWAIPTLQLNIGGGRYDDGTIVSRTDPFTLYAYLIPDPTNGNGYGKAALGDTYYISAALVGPDGKVDVAGNFGSFAFNGATIPVTSGMTYGTPPIEVLASQQGSDSGDLPQHGIYSTYFRQFEFQFNSAVSTSPFNTQYNPGRVPVDNDGGMYFSAFTVDTRSLTDGYEIHFDLYNATTFEQIKRGVTLTDTDIVAKAPFSHDAQSSSQVPEAGALLLFGTGLIGLVGYRRVRRMQ